MTIEKGGVVRLDTDDKLLHHSASGFPITGSIAIGAVTGGGGGTVDTTTTWNLGAVTSGHTQIIGACKFNLNNDAAGLAFDRWHTVMGGDILWVMDGELLSSSTIGDNLGLYEFVSYHFRVSGGQAQLVRRLFITSGGTALYTVLAHTISYKLRSGNWT